MLMQCNGKFVIASIIVRDIVVSLWRILIILVHGSYEWGLFSRTELESLVNDTVNWWLSFPNIAVLWLFLTWIEP